MPSRTRKFRGSRTHGRGVKAGRGAGKQGGRGNAGLHKYKFKSMLIYCPDHFGRHGFKRPAAAQSFPVAVNVGELDTLIPHFQARDALVTEGTTLVVDLTKAGIERLLGGGKTEKTWKVIVEHASEHARSKVTVLKSPGDADGGKPPLPSGKPGSKPEAPAIPKAERAPKAEKAPKPERPAATPPAPKPATPAKPSPSA